VVAFRDGRARAMPFGQLEGVALGARATFQDRINAIHPRYAALNKIIEGVAMKGKTR
jgi:flagellum-specific ATP synthase